MTNKEQNTPRPAKKAVQMSVVQIGIDDYYLLPSNKALALVEIMQSAQVCRDTFDRRERYITSGQAPDLSLTVVKPHLVKTVDAGEFRRHFYFGGDEGGE